MRINLFIFLLFIHLAFFSNCTTDYFGFSEDEEGPPDYLRNPVALMAYCNKFNINGFNGFLVAYYDWNEEAFDKNKAQLYLANVPYEFTYPPTNYIQVHSFYIANNQKVFNKTPVSMDIFNDSSSERSVLVTTIGHDLLEDTGGISIDELIQTNSFVLRDMNGWHGITLSVFDVQNKPMKTAEILIPPFEANPNTFLNAHNEENRLFQLHPFVNISQNTNTTDQTFYEKGLDFCKESQVQFDIPAFETQSPAEDPVDKLIEDLSFLPDDLSQQ